MVDHEEKCRKFSVKVVFRVRR